jgi:hypothetical protein
MATNITNSNGSKLTMAPREEDLAELQNLLRELQGRVDQARTDGHVYMMGQYARMISLVSPEIDRVQRRFIREMKASINKDHRDLRAEARVEAITAKAERDAADRARAEALAEAMRNAAGH